MASPTRAGIEFRGNALRYAEVEENRNNYRLVRLGSCDFDFDAEEQMFGGEEAVWLSTIADALLDVFRGTEAERLTVVVNPGRCIAASIPVPAEATEDERLEFMNWDAAQWGASERLRVSSSFIRDDEINGREFQWYEATALAPLYHARIEQIVAALPPKDIEITASYRGADKAVHPAAANGTGRGLSLGLGVYDRSVEFFLNREGTWIGGTHAMTSEMADYPYFATAFLQASGFSPREVTHVFGYGERYSNGVAGTLSRIISAPALRINPLQLVNVEAEALRAEFSPEVFAPCVGACI